MQAGIDYLSFTVPAMLSGVEDHAEAWGYARQALERFGLSALMGALDQVPFEGLHARFAYAVRRYYPLQHINIHFGGKANHILVELAGAGCQWLRDSGEFSRVALLVEERATRLDVACDLGDVKPAAFVAAGYDPTFESRGTIKTGVGETEYVGNMKSERFARVYRYALPHPRADQMRVEHVLRRSIAKSGLVIHRQQGLESLVASCGAVFGWKHPAWSLERVTALRGERAAYDQAATLRWVETAVLPCLRRLIREGLIDEERFCARLGER